MDLAAIKAKQQKTWASGDFSVVASRIVLVSEQLAESADLRAGWRVLDVACGNGNATLAAARSGTQVVGVDYVPELLEDGAGARRPRGWTSSSGSATRRPCRSRASFDAVLSRLRHDVRPRPPQAADEVVRVARPGGTVALASWTPAGSSGEMFRVITSHVPAPAGVASPLLWGTEEHLVRAVRAGRRQHQVGRAGLKLEVHLEVVVRRGRGTSGFDAAGDGLALTWRDLDQQRFAIRSRASRR